MHRAPDICELWKSFVVDDDTVAHTYPEASLHKYQNRYKYCHQLDRYLMKITVFQQDLHLLKLAGGRKERYQKIKVKCSTMIKFSNIMEVIPRHTTRTN